MINKEINKRTNLKKQTNKQTNIDIEKGLKVAVAFDTYVQDGRVETCGRSVGISQIKKNVIFRSCKIYISDSVMYFLWQV